MTEPSLLVICLAAFVAVMVLLTLLAVLFALLTRLFPVPVKEETDTGVVAAIHSAVAAAYPGTRITAIEEVR